MRELPKLTLAKLTEQERTLLLACEKNIFNTIAGFRAFGASLATVNVQRLYRETHASFEDYCAERWSLSRCRAYQYMEAADVAIALDKQGVKVENEGQARELAKVPEEKRVEVYNKVASLGKVTAARIHEAALALTQTETTAGDVKKIIQPKVEREAKRLTATLAELISECADSDLLSIESDINWLFLEVEANVIERHPDMIPSVEKTLRNLLAKIEAKKVAA